MQFSPHLLKSIAFAPSLSSNVYPSMPMAVRTHDLSASVSANWKACSYAEGERANFVTQVFDTLVADQERHTWNIIACFTFEQNRELVTLIALFRLTCHEQW